MFDKTYLAVGKDTEKFFMNMKKNNLIKIYSSLYLQKKDKFCQACGENTLKSQNFIIFNKKRLDSAFFFLTLQYENETLKRPLDLFVSIPQSFESSQLAEKTSEDKENPFFLMGIVFQTSKKNKEIVFFRDFLGDLDTFKRLDAKDKEKEYSWIDIWEEVLKKNARPCVLLYIQ